MTTDRWTSGSHYDRWMGRWSRLLAQEFLQWLDLPAGLRWLDVCCGSGIITEAIEDRNAPTSIVGIDASPEQINFARDHRTHLNVTFQTGDAISLPFPDATFDAVVCGLGLNYVPNPVGALKEFCRVTSPGGTIAVYLWDYAQGARFLREFWDAAIAVDHEAATFDQARRFPMCNPESLQSLFEQAGLKQTSHHALEVVTHFPSFEDYWEPLLTGQGSAPNYLATRDQQIQTAIRERLRAALPADSRGAIDLPARAWAIRAHNPGV
jgi:ubiquinone/menaquinone biosynthesis C-methylase UbiE